MRLAWYAGASTALAVGVVASAFHQRANFYSATVHLSQSSLSLMILVNLIFLIYGSFVYGLQRLCFGQLRPVEIEQLYEKAWFAVTETCLAMTIFREEVGAFFLVMFTALVTGKVWGWISEGRIEVLEQQPPANPRLFHTRLSISLMLSFVYDLWLLNYALNTVVQQARPTMMVMFLFEFAILTVSSCHTGCRYLLSLAEARVVKQQTAQRLEDRRRQIREQRVEILRRRETEGATETEQEAAEPLPSEDDVDEMDIEVPGWESKGQWVLGLDLLADFIKMGIYTAFFCVLFTFYGLPIHIMRDVFMTTRSFVKRLHALLRYRQALRDMNKYPDATADELSREDTCIICREEMRPWDPANPGQVERSRPKKLPCGHILHFGCLKSWLERQQVCPTCRRSVTMDAPPPARNADAMLLRLGLGVPRNPGQQPAAAGAAPGGAQGAPVAQGAGVQGGQGGAQNGQQNGANVRMFNFGPIRLIFAQGDAAAVQENIQQGMPPNAANPQAAAEQDPEYDQDTTDPGLVDGIRDELADINQRVVEAGRRMQQDLQHLQSAEAQLFVLNLLVEEMARLNHIGQAAQQQQQQQEPQHNTTAPNASEPGPSTQPRVQAQVQPQHPQQGQPIAPAFQAFPAFPGQYAQFPPMQPFNPPAARIQAPIVTRHGGAPFSAAIPAGSPELPEGVVIPPGWSLLPLHRIDGTGPLPQVPTTAHPQVQAPRPIATRSRQAPSELYSELAASGGLNTHSNRNDGQGNGEAAGTSSSSASHLASQQEQRGRSPPAPSSSRMELSGQQARTASPQVTAPTPILPNWGGSAQLFGAGSRSGRATGADIARPTPDAPSTSTAVQERQHEEKKSDQDRSTKENGTTSTDKGKGRVATVEDDDSDDDS